MIPEGTADKLDDGETAPIGIVVDGSDSKTASVASGYAAQIISAFNQRAARRRRASSCRGRGSTRECG